MESKIYIKLNYVEVYVGRCVDGKIFAYRGHRETPIGVYQDDVVWRGYGLEKEVAGKYVDNTVWKGWGLGNQSVAGRFKDGKIYEGYGLELREVGRYEGEPIAAAAALLLREEFEKVNNLKYEHAKEPNKYQPPKDTNTKPQKIESIASIPPSRGVAPSSTRSPSGGGSSVGSSSGSSTSSYGGVGDGGSVVGGFVMCVVSLLFYFVLAWIIGFSSDTLDALRDVCLANESAVEKIITCAVIAWTLYFPIITLIKKETMLLWRSCIAALIMLVGYGGLFYAIIHFGYDVYHFLSAEFLYYSGWFLHAIGVLIMPFIGMCLFAAPVLLIGSTFTVVFHNAIAMDDDFVVNQSKFVTKASIYGGLVLLTIYMLLEYSFAGPFALLMEFVLYGISAYCVGKYASKMVDAYFIPEHFGN